MMTAMLSIPACAQGYYDYLMQHRRGAANEHWLAQMYASCLLGQSALPLYLGLPLDVFRSMMDYHFPTLKTLPLPTSIHWPTTPRLAELEALRTLLHQHASNPADSSSGWMVEILCAGCMGDHQLWQDLGLWSQQELSNLMHINFHSLVKKNNNNMKWKNFLYRQLAEVDGIQRSPSCGSCIDYAACFGAEEEVAPDTHYAQALTLSDLSGITP